MMERILYETNRHIGYLGFGKIYCRVLQVDVASKQHN